MESIGGDRAGSVTEVRAKGRCHVMRGDQEVTLLEEGGRVHGIQTACPHGGGRLGDGVVDGDQVVCPLHRWRFDLNTGKTKRDPRLPSVKVPVEVDGDDIRWKARDGVL